MVARKVMLTPRLYPPGWEVWWLNPPPHPFEDRPGIPSSTWLASRISRRDAVELCAAEGWEVIQ